MASAAQVAASRLNGALSHGPTSDSGKATSSRNALRTGLTGRTVLLPSQDAALYEAHLAQFREQYQPVGDQELALVQSLGDTEWRLARIPSLEMGIFALGRMEFADLFPEYDEGSRKILIDAKVFLAYQRQLVNLGIQEGRLRRQGQGPCCPPGSTATPDPESSSPLGGGRQALYQCGASKPPGRVRPEALGFEFTLEQIEVRAIDIEPDLFHEWALEQGSTANPLL